MENDSNLTQKIDSYQKANKILAKDALEIVYKALCEKGYDPVNQIVGYIMSGDPTYITSHNDARGTISKIERDELLEEVVKFYLNKNMDLGK